MRSFYVLYCVLLTGCVHFTCCIVCCWQDAFILRAVLCVAGMMRSFYVLYCVLLTRCVHFTCCIVCCWHDDFILRAVLFEWITYVSFVCPFSTTQMCTYREAGVLAADRLQPCVQATRCMHVAEKLPTSRGSSATKPTVSETVLCGWVVAYRSARFTILLSAYGMYLCICVVLKRNYSFPPCNVTLLTVFITDTKCVHCAVRTEYLNIFRLILFLFSWHT